MDWKVTRLFVQRASSGPLGLRRGETFTVRPDEVSGLAASADQQGATALLATLEDLKPADLADVMRDLPQDSQMRVAAELTDERLADVLEELGNEDAVALLSRLKAGRRREFQVTADRKIPNPRATATITRPMPPEERPSRSHRPRCRS